MLETEMTEASLGNIFNSHLYVGKTKKLTREREKELWDRWKDYKDYKARETFLTAYLPLCLRMTYEIARNNLDQQDLISDLFGEAQAEMVRLFDKGKFNPELGRFHNLAIPYLKSAMLRFVRDNKAPFKLCTTHKHAVIFNNISRVERQLDQEFPRLSSHARHLKIAEKLGSAGDEQITAEDVLDFVLRRQSIGLSADAPAFGAEDSETIADRASTGDDPLSILQQAEQAQREERMHTAIEKLDPRSRDIIKQRYLSPEPQTLHDLALTYGISDERIRQIEVAALKKIKAEVNRNILPKLVCQPDAPS
jgi:RNA polymerase sigma-32 factor